MSIYYISTVSMGFTLNKHNLILVTTFINEKIHVPELNVDTLYLTSYRPIHYVKIWNKVSLL